jgi:hypothetical protein
MPTAMGETWRGYSQVGLEDPDDPGNAVVATRRTYFTDATPPDPGVETRYHEFSTGNRERALAATNGPFQPQFQLEQQLSPSEGVELLLATVQGDVTPTTPGGGTDTRDWLFSAADPDPAKMPDYQTHEIHDGVRAWIMGGCQGSQLEINGSANGTNLARVTYMGLTMAPGTMATGLDERTPEFVEGWETALWLDAFGDAPGTTPIDDLLINWQVIIANDPQRKFTARNVNAARGLRIGKFLVTARFTIEAASDSALDIYNDAMGPVYATIRARMGDNHTIEGALKSFVQFDIAGAWKIDNLSGTDANTRTYGATLTNLVEPTELACSAQILLRNNRASAY